MLVTKLLKRHTYSRSTKWTDYAGIVYRVALVWWRFAQDHTKVVVIELYILFACCQLQLLVFIGLIVRLVCLMCINFAVP